MWICVWLCCYSNQVSGCSHLILRSGYHHVDIVPHHRKYLGFEWGGKYFVLPFGLSTAPYVFTKLLRPLVGLWRGKGHKVILYLDDGICAVAGEREAGITSQWVKSSLSKLLTTLNQHGLQHRSCSGLGLLLI